MLRLSGVMLALVSGCHRVRRRQRTEPGGAGSAGTGAAVITVDGSSTVFPVTEAVAEEFQKQNQGTQVTVGTLGHRRRVPEILPRRDGRLQRVASDRAPPKSKPARRRGIKYIELPIAYDGMAVVVNPKNTWAPSMTVAELKKLWSPEAQGKVMRWNQVRAELAESGNPSLRRGRRLGDVRLFHRSDQRQGQGQPRRLHVERGRQHPRSGRRRRPERARLHGPGLLRREQGQDEARRRSTTRIRRTARARLRPSAETVRNGTYRPLSRPIFIYVNTAALSRPEVQKFIEYYVDVGDAARSEVGYVPLTDAEQKLVQQRFAAKTTGTMFGASTRDRIRRSASSSG